MKIKQTDIPNTAYFYSDLYTQIENMDKAIEVECTECECNSIRVLLIRNYGKGVFATNYNDGKLTIWRKQ